MQNGSSDLEMAPKSPIASCKRAWMSFINIVVTFLSTEADQYAASNGICASPIEVEQLYYTNVNGILQEATLKIPEIKKPIYSGKKGIIQRNWAISLQNCNIWRICILIVNGSMNIDADIRKVLEAVTDPEIPVISIEELGILREIVQEKNSITVFISPTYSGIPLWTS